MSKKAVILLPTFNEKENIESFTKEVLAQEKNSPGYSFDVLIVDSHSPDGTYEIAQKLARQNNKIHTLLVGKGLGVGLIEGHKFSIKNLKPDVLVQLDADGQVDVSILPKLISTIDKGYNLALGSRFVEGGENKLSFSRRFFSTCMSWYCRIMMGPWGVREFANSARAFTPELFKKINFERLPWKEKTFIIQPAFLHEAILAGAKYKEVPLIFKNRAEGYSKNKVLNYSYDVITYAIDVRLQSLGIYFPFFKASRRAKTIIKFGLVGFTGTLIDFIFYKIFINIFGVPPATSKGFSSEIAIINNFLLNNFWTFRHRDTHGNIWSKLFVFNLVSLGGLAIAVLIVKFLHSVYGDGFINILGKDLAYNNFYFFATIPPVLIWNFTINNLITWRHKKV